MPRARLCAHCGAKATERWDLRPCAIGRWRRFDLCASCDIELNALVLAFTRLPEGPALLERYRRARKHGPATTPANITMRDADRAVKLYLEENAA